MPPIGVLAPLPDVLLIMGGKVVTILDAETVLCPAIIMMIAITISLSFCPITIVSILRHT